MNINLKEFVFWVLLAIIITDSKVVSSYIKSKTGKSPQEYGYDTGVKMRKFFTNENNKSR